MFKIVMGKRVYIGGSKRYLKDKICLLCKKSFRPRGSSQKYCSLKCKRSVFKPIIKEKLYKINKDTKCWEWLGVLDIGGYARPFTFKCKRTVPHRYFYEDYYKTKIPKDLQLDHLCRNRKCVNPEHLEPVTHAENIRRGNATKLNKNQIKLIRLIREKYNISYREIAKNFNITHQHVYRIVKKLRWADI